jgi:cysteine sulfinate desulfinase/cysteine desulfurase-like protein
VRFSLGRPSSGADVERAGDVLEETLKTLRRA